MKIAVPTESRPGERRVALVPDMAARLVKAGFEVAIAAGAGRHAYFADEAYRAAGADVVADPVPGAQVVLSVQPLPVATAAGLARGTLTISFLPTRSELELVRTMREAGVTALAVELVPRISRAQSMDALSSQALVAGYRSALIAAERLPRFLPLFMTAAGTVPPAKILVLGAGVAGLQAISTARRLGAVVSAYDVRAAAAEEVRSLGAKFVELELEALEGAGGYAREMTEDRAARQRELLTPYISSSDALITTAAVPGRDAPRLVTADMLAGMKPGSVVVDLAAETGGNVEGSRPGEEIVVGDGVLLWGAANVPSQMPVHASQLYAKNLVSLVELMSDGGVVTLDFDDEIVAGCAVTHDGTVTHSPTAALLDGA